MSTFFYTCKGKHLNASIFREIKAKTAARDAERNINNEG